MARKEEQGEGEGAKRGCVGPGAKKLWRWRKGNGIGLGRWGDVGGGFDKEPLNALG